MNNTQYDAFMFSIIRFLRFPQLLMQLLQTTWKVFCNLFPLSSRDGEFLQPGQKSAYVSDSFRRACFGDQENQLAECLQRHLFYTTYSLRFSRFEPEKSQRRAPNHPDFPFLLNTSAGFHLLVCWLIYDLVCLPRVAACSLKPYLSYCLDGFRQRGDLDLHRVDYRTYAEYKNLSVFLRRLFHTPRDGRTLFCYSSTLSGRIPPDYLSLPAKSNNRRGYPSLQLSPRIVQRLSRYTRIARRSSFSICQSPDVSSIAGNFISPIITQVF
jgi:hypothetical protein